MLNNEIKINYLKKNQFALTFQTGNSNNEFWTNLIKKIRVN